MGSDKNSNEHHFPHIPMPKVIYHQNFIGSNEIQTLGLTIDLEESDILTWNIKGFHKFLRKHLISYCYPSIQYEKFNDRNFPDMYEGSFEFLRKYCDRWRKGKNPEQKEQDFRAIQGVLGEWFLHAFSRTFFDTESLYSKVYLHQGGNAVHGFDLVHFKLEENDLGFSIWLGEAKFYNSVSSAITNALESLNNACSYDYLKAKESEAGINGEIAFISKYAAVMNRPDNETIKRICTYLDSVNRNDFLKQITIPVLLVIPNLNVKNLENRTIEEIRATLRAVTKKTSGDFFSKISTHFSELQNINIRLFVLPLGNHEELVVSFEDLIKKVTDHD